MPYIDSIHPTTTEKLKQQSSYLSELLNAPNPAENQQLAFEDAGGIKTHHCLPPQEETSYTSSKTPAHKKGSLLQRVLLSS